MKRANNPQGLITALVTPFQDGEIDFASLKRLVKMQLDQGVQGFVVNGTTAESPTLSDAEVKKLFAFIKSEVSGQVPLIVGTGSNSTAKTAEFSREVSGWGPQAILVVVPYYNRPPQRGLTAHFREVAKASSVPVVLYNVPSRTVAGLEAATIAGLSQDENIVGIKEATGNMELLESIRAASAKDFVLLSGDDGSCIDFCARGGHGVISVSSHLIAEDMLHFLGRAYDGDKSSNPEYRTKYADLMKWLYIEANPIPVKMALHWMGILASPELRLPLVSLDEKFHKEFKECLKKLALL
ncbi:MAG: 4-hydroxy-tetrahydrodipicolinate synthase [Bdellovibrionaceae bacterium]|nr:4-hydroxy-tetrahydrodipicolinate synthase [Pseudobdellovibrionaceae bacterium]